MTKLFDPLTLGALSLPNRVFMAPLTRMRSSQPGNVPNRLNALYYAQRACAGLIISEATQVSAEGQGYPATPGIYTAAQIEGWSNVTRAVHDNGGRMFLQLWHVGRISHCTLQPDNALPVAPSAVKPKGMAMTADWKFVEFDTPRALRLDEMARVIRDFRRGAERAKQAEFDGVEVHGANGYLLDQFLQDGSNKRTDLYGGTIANRARLLLEVVDQAIEVWGPDRVGVRLSPYGTFNDMSDSDPMSLFSYVLEQLSKRGIAYAHLIEPRASSAGAADTVVPDMPSAAQTFRKAFPGVIVSAGGYQRESAIDVVEQGSADAVAFGRLFISNPDLVERLRKGAQLSRYDRHTFYGGTEAGYTDYAMLCA